MKYHALKDDSFWYKDAVIYELHVRAFADSNGDGIGDFRGLTRKLDYLEGLGVTAIWLLPFYPSPLKDDGYDIADYYRIHPDYGTLRDFKEFLKAAHSRGIRVIAELVINHTSSDHRWFKRARTGKKGSAAREMYVWSEDPQKYREARIIFKDFEQSNWSWDPRAQAYYWHRFYSHQPDLNFDNPAVRREVMKVIDFWFNLGVDGMRLDAVPYLFEREGTNCENLPETHAFLRELRSHIDSVHKNKMLLAEANQWPEDAVEYMTGGEECHMAFHFPLMPRIFMSMQMEDCFPIIDILDSTPSIEQSCQWAIFLRNHDELTLEMVTDEERDYMYRVFARDAQAKINLGIRRRLAPLLGNNRKKIELVNILLFSFPGTPVLYYGDEIGMGDNFYLGDRNGVRTPMQWSPDRNAGFSDANPHRIYLPVLIDPEYHFEAINVENQDRNLSSLLWWMRRVVAMRKRFKAFGRGNIGLLYSDNPKILAFTRTYEEETILVVANLSRFSQVAHLNIADYAGLIPREVFSQNCFPRIRKRPYVLTLGPYNHYWLLLEKKAEGKDMTSRALPEIVVKKSWEQALSGAGRAKLEEQALVRYIRGARWFGAKSRTIRRLSIIEDAAVGSPAIGHLLVLEISFADGAPEHYLLPVCYSPSPHSERMLEDAPQHVICRVSTGLETGVLFDGTQDERSQAELLALIARRRKLKGSKGAFHGVPGRAFRKIAPHGYQSLSSRALKAEQSNSSIIYDDLFFMKLYRKLDEGINPELEVISFLTEQTSFEHIPPYGGAIAYRRDGMQPMTIALLQGFVKSSADAWTYAQSEITRYFERILQQHSATPPPASKQDFLSEAMGNTPVPDVLLELIGDLYLDMVSLLGERTAQMHLALGSSVDGDGFRPEPFTLLYQRSMYQSMQSLVRRTFLSFSRNARKLPERARDHVDSILSREKAILGALRQVTRRKIHATKIRIHGDYHLGQVLYTGKDFIIMDFEGEPARALSERKLKHSPFKDVAGMIRSFHYAAYGALFLNTSFRAEDIDYLEPWIEPLFRTISSAFLSAYLRTVDGADFVPSSNEELETMIRIYLLEKAVYELGYELNNRPEWVIIPVKGIEQVVESAAHQ